MSTIHVQSVPCHPWQVSTIYLPKLCNKYSIMRVIKFMQQNKATSTVMHYGITWILIKLMQFINMKFIVMKLNMYILWTLISIILNILFFWSNVNIFSYMAPFIIHSINFFFMYEMVFHKPDMAHTIHHILTIMVQCMGYYSGYVEKYPLSMIIFNTSHVGFFSSIFSSLRDITKDTHYHQLVKNIYYNSYLLAKIGGIIVYYMLCFYFRHHIQLSGYEHIWITYACVHVVQLFFCWKILKIKRRKRNKNN